MYYNCGIKSEDKKDKKFMSFMLSPLSKQTKNLCNDCSHCRGKNESWKAMEVAEERKWYMGMV